MSCDCNTLVVGEAGVQGPQGLAGINGTNGANGINAYSTLIGEFTQPSVGAAVSFSVSENRWMGIGQTIYISQAGYYTVTSTVLSSPYSSVQATLLRADGVSPGDQVIDGLTISPSAGATYSDPLDELNVNGPSSLDGSVIINSSGANVNVQVDGDTRTKVLYMQGSTNRVGVLLSTTTAVPASDFHVNGNFKVGSSAGGQSGSEIGSASDFTAGAVINSLKIDQSGKGDFVVKTTGSDNLLVVKAGGTYGNRVGIGTATPAQLLDVAGIGTITNLIVNGGGTAANPTFQVYGTSGTRPITVVSTSTPTNRVGIFNTSPTVPLDVVGDTKITGAFNATGAVTFGSTVGITGAATLASLGVTGAATVGTTLGVTGLSTLASLAVTTSATVGTTLGVTGATTLSSTLAAGASTLASLGVTGAATVGTTLAVTGASTLTGDVTVGSNVLAVKATGLKVGIKTTTPATELDVVGSVQATDYRISTGSGAAKLTRLNTATGTQKTLNLAPNASQAETDTTVLCSIGDFVIGSLASVPGSPGFTSDIMFTCQVIGTNTISTIITNTNASGSSNTYTDLVQFNYLVIRAVAS
jgi:hypothetical protein